MTRASDYRRGLALGQMLARIDDLERQVSAERGARRVLQERVDSLSASLARAWKELEQLRPMRFHAPKTVGASPLLHEPRVPLERVSVSEAARRLDVDGETVKRWIEAGVLEGEARLEPGRRYRRWSVVKRSVDARAENVEIAGARTG